MEEHANLRTLCDEGKGNVEFQDILKYCSFASTYLSLSLTACQGIFQAMWKLLSQEKCAAVHFYIFMRKMLSGILKHRISQADRWRVSAQILKFCIWFPFIFPTGKLQWERDIPQDALDNLQNLANTDFKKNLGKIIHDIYLTGHNLFKDMPQGDHKKRAKYRFASKTLMRILPDNLKTEVETLINQKSMTLDLYEILGQCTWGQGKSL